MTRRTLFLLSLALPLASVPMGAWAAEAAVTIDNFTFSPARLVVAAGTKVTWTNHDDIPHKVVGSPDPAALDSPVLDTNEAFSQTFDRPGTYPYFCSLHPHMQGQVVVQ